jgi:hypothetical protein
MNQDGRHCEYIRVEHLWMKNRCCAFSNMNNLLIKKKEIYILIYDKRKGLFQYCILVFYLSGRRETNFYQSDGDELSRLTVILRAWIG